ncbi:MAG: helicase-related protein [Bacillota bacterium]|nr:helicase-related protein [Bacillota bacterium]
MKEDLYDPLETVYAGLDRQGRVAGVWTGEPAAVAAWASAQGLARLRPLTYPVPVALAEELVAAVRRRLKSGGGGGREVEDLASLARQELRHRGLPARVRLEERGVAGEGLPPAGLREALRATLLGKRLLAAEVLRFRPAGEALFPEAVSLALGFLRLSGEIESEAAVGRDGDGAWRCRRCGSARIQEAPCANCGDPACPVCPDCALLGEARACRRLYFLPDRRPCPEVMAPAGAATGERPLTAAQRRAAGALLAWLCDPGAPAEALLWAVCGAGKTAVVRPVVEQALASGWRVLYASPRRQVIRQVASELPRGGLTLATAHQALRHQEAFDLMVLDEPDAYPYRGNSLLRAGVRRAAKAGARWLYLTATPDPELLARVESGAVHRVLLPRRFHGHPAPVPRLLTPTGWPGEETRRQGIPLLAAEVIAARLEQVNRRFLVFTPTVALCHRSRAELARRLPVPVGAVDAGSPEREELVSAFRRGDLRVLVSTSVLERGVTFPFVDVVVLYADHPLFDQVSLLQMAGRAGRTPDDPAGEVWFVAGEVTPEMGAAREWVQALNEAAG